MKLLRNIFVVCATVLLVSAAMAQGGGRGQGRGMMGRGNDAGSLLRREDVQKELKLTDDQKGKLKEVSDKINQERRDLFQNSGGDFQAAQADMQKKQPEWDKQIMGVLNADQSKRLKELMVQRGGNMIAMNPAFQKDLGITDDQKAKLKDLQTKQMEAMMALGQKMRDQEITQEEMRDSVQKNMKTMEEAVGKILTDAQKAKIKEMGGAAFKFEEGNGG